ncbi:hypothetical protein P618_200283 [Holospora obtusa F1]|uniref:Uncharacterized protein n=2 Tax=Holospora obtusa TaxID=49893 RepID=W6TUU3_HOLOB|nr:hypothetical protein P618_200283 [Holospora obtusa F1]
MEVNEMGLKMSYESLEEIMEEIFYYDDEDHDDAMGGITEYHWMEFLPKFAVKKDLLKALDRYFNMWDLGERGVDYLEKIGEFYEYERASWCFYYLFMTLGYLENPSFIPSVMKYFPDEWYMEGMWSQPMVGVITARWPDYVPWLMRSLHLLPSKELNYVASDFMFKMIFKTFYRITPDEFPKLYVVDALHLGNRIMIKNLVEKEISEWKDSLKKAQEKLQKVSREQEKKVAQEDVESAKESLACAEYVLGQLLLLPEEVVGIGHR